MVPPVGEAVEQFKPPETWWYPLPSGWKGTIQQKNIENVPPAQDTSPKWGYHPAEKQQNVLIYGYPSIALERICIIDLNERNLLDKDKYVIKQVLDKFTSLLEEYRGSASVLCHNIDALKNEHVQMQMLSVFSLLSMSGHHFVTRDILGTISYILVSCTDNDGEGTGYYYDALFEGDNELMKFANQFDPVLLSSPSWDEKLWNGEIVDGWQLDTPQRAPRF